MGDQHTVGGSGTPPGKFRLALTVLFVGLLVVASTLGVFNLVFPFKPGTKGVAAHMHQATGAIQSALAAVPVFPKLDQRLNVLVMGVDWNGHDSERYQGTRSDTMMLVSLDPDAEKIGIISIPRDSHVSVGNGRGLNKINQAHAIGGPKMAMATVAENFEVPVDNYVVVDTEGLKELFKLLGPVEVVVEKEMHYVDHTSGLNIDLKPGKQLLNAEQAEGYVRFRKDATADIGRMERQQWFLRQSLSKLKDPAIVMKAPQLLEAGYKCVKTDLPLDRIAAIMAFAKDLPAGSIMTATLPGEGTTVDGVNYFMLSQKGTHAVFERFGLVPPSTERARYVYDGSSADESIRKKSRISIKYRELFTPQAEAMANQLRERGWHVRQIVTRLENDCLHAQLDLNNRRASSEVLSLLSNDLPEVKEWPVVVKYGCGVASDITVVLPAPTGIGMEGTTAAIPPSSDPTAIQIR